MVALAHSRRPEIKYRTVQEYCFNDAESLISKARVVYHEGEMKNIELVANKACPPESLAHIPDILKEADFDVRGQSWHEYNVPFSDREELIVVTPKYIAAESDVERLLDILKENGAAKGVHEVGAMQRQSCKGRNSWKDTLSADLKAVGGHVR